ncbi:MAG: hypothetical protein LAO79_01570 [Acidobacteriia bacterium]|nr:hypothetical protein [Terriglobia bacterium]
MADAAPAPSDDLMRVLAHELRQPLSTIESIAYYLTLILPEEQKVHEQLDRIQLLVEQSNWMLTSGQFIADPLPGQREDVDLRDLVGEIELAGFDVQFADPLPAVRADAPLLRALVENLVILFRQFPPTAALRIQPGCLEFSCAAHGRSEASLGPGSTLCIQGARRVAESFGGSLQVSVDPSAEIRVRVMLT